MIGGGKIHWLEGVPICLHMIVTATAWNYHPATSKGCEALPSNDKIHWHKGVLLGDLITKHVASYSFPNRQR